METRLGPPQRRPRRRAFWLGTIAACAAVVLCAPAGAIADKKHHKPTIAYTIEGIRGTNGWFRGSAGGNFVVLRWDVNDPDAIVVVTSGCDTERISGPEPGTTRTCTAVTDNGITSLTTEPIKIDAQPPTAIAAKADRPPDHNGWYNHPVTIHWSGADAISGIASCTSVTYGGPDRGRARLVGSCVDGAGNTSAPSRFLFKYDGTPPRLGRVGILRAALPLRLHWTASKGARFLVTRAPGNSGAPVSVVYRGLQRRFTDRTAKNGVDYTYTVQALDQAGNTVVKTIKAAARQPLLAPAPGARLSSPRSLVFSWLAVPGASYYNIQLWVSGRKVMSAWPNVARFRLAAPWQFDGVRRSLSPGRYTWYVWPAHGPRSRGAYAPLLGESTFVVGR